MHQSKIVTTAKSGRVLSFDQKKRVLKNMILILKKRSEEILAANSEDVHNYEGKDQAMYDRLILNQKKVDGMIQSIQTVLQVEEDPVGQILYEYDHPNGMVVENRTAPFGTIMIIYESRPDVTIEAAVIAFMAGNKIMLKGGKESRLANLLLVECWHEALEGAGISNHWIQYLDYPRDKTQHFLMDPPLPIDLIVPRGGEKLIDFVKQHGSAPVLVSGRGNNFIYIHDDADWDKVFKLVTNSKTDKISACNALDKVLINANTYNLDSRASDLIDQLQSEGVSILLDKFLSSKLNSDLPVLENEAVWYEEFLSMKIVLGAVDSLSAAIDKINHYSGGHTVTIITEGSGTAEKFMSEIDAAAVMHNASTRFTDGGQFGLGAELAISTDKLHHRGPLGLEHLVTNKWYVFGEGQTR